MTQFPDRTHGECSRDGPGTSTSLIQAAKDRSEAAWERLVALYSPMIYGWIRSRGLQPEDAADVLQEVMRSVAQSLHTFQRDPSGGTFRGWLSRIVQRRTDDFFRAEANRPRPAGGSAARSFFEAVPDGASESSVEPPRAPTYAELFEPIIRQVRSEFSERNWQIFWMVVVQEQSTADVARLMNVTPNVVRLAKSRIARRLRDAVLEKSDGRTRSAGAGE